MSALHTTDFFCFYCGTKLPYGSSFCSQCGRQVVNEFLPNEVLGDYRQKSAKAQKKPIAVGVIFLICGLWAITWSILMGIQETVPIATWVMELATGCSMLLIALYTLFFYKKGYFLVFISMLILAGRYVYLSIGYYIWVLVAWKETTKLWVDRPFGWVETELLVSPPILIYICLIIVLAVMALINIVGAAFHYRKRFFRITFGVSCIMHILLCVFAQFIPSVLTCDEMYGLLVVISVVAIGGNIGPEILYYLPVDITAIFLINRIAKKYIYQQKSK